LAHLSADVDGDGSRDRVYQRHARFGTVKIGVCTASGVTDEVVIGGMGEVFGVMDVEPDGRWEIYGGGTGVNSVVAIPITLVDGRLRRVQLGGDDLWLTADGYPDNHRRHGYGCENVYGDARKELVQVTLDYRADTVTRVGYLVVGAHADEVSRQVSAIPSRWNNPKRANSNEFANPCRTRTE
jgi:hypothetical protein